MCAQYTTQCSLVEFIRAGLILLICVIAHNRAENGTRASMTHSNQLLIQDSRRKHQINTHFLEKASDLVQKLTVLGLFIFAPGPMLPLLPCL